MKFGEMPPQEAPKKETPQDNLSEESKHEKFVPSSVPKVEMDKQIEEGEQKEAEEKEAEVRKVREAREQREYNRHLQMRKQGRVGDITNLKAEGILKEGNKYYSVYDKKYAFREDIDWSNLKESGHRLSELQEEHEVIPNYKPPTY